MAGLFSARNLKRRRKKFRWNSRAQKKKLLKLWKLDPFEGAPLAKAIVLKKKGVEQKQPHSGIIKAVRCQLLKNGIQVTAFVPGDGAIKHIDEHDEVLLEGLGASQGGAVGSMHGIKYRVIAVNGVALSEILKGKKEKPKGA
ncbi:MAG: 30S ribosomal protein S12 [Candidatus Aenigmatarchaeota archaeon]|nr:MAG: 30S ribosomal protein S12 [Candidatus Aenigmarchaeota archaeon]